MLGELIVHVLTNLLFKDYKTIVPYFNLEERSIKKGFDSVIYSPDIGIWVYEVKSSKQQGTVNLDSKTKRLIKTAHEDLSGKLAQQDETSRIWDNAMNGFQVACGHLGDEKEILQNIILDFQETANTVENGPNTHNVILSSVLFSENSDEIGASCVAEKHQEYNASYRKLMIFAVHKSLSVDLMNFFEQEAVDEAS